MRIQRRQRQWGVKQSAPFQWNGIAAVDSPISPRTHAAERVRWRAPRLEVGRLRHRDEARAGRCRVRIPDTVRVAHQAGVGEVLVDRGAIADCALDGRGEGEGGDSTEDGKKGDGQHRGDGMKKGA